MGNMNPNSTNYVHSYEPNTNDLTMAMDYNSNGEPVIRVHASGITFTGNVSIDDVTIDNTISNPVPVTIQNECLGIQNCGDSVLNIAGAVTQGTNPWIISANSSPNGPENEIFIKLTNEVLTVAGNVSIIVGEDPVSLTNPMPVSLGDACIKVENCDGTRLNVNSNSIIMLNELPVASSNPLPVTLGESCIQVSNCGTDGVLNVSGAITVEGVEVTVENPFPVDLRNTCIGVENCEGTSLEVKLTDGLNDIGFLLNDNDGQTPNTYSIPVENFNMVWNGSSWDRMPGNAISGVAVNITNSCLSVANCAESVLNVAGDMNLLINGSEVSSDNPVPVTIPNCVSIQNCGEGSLSIIGQVELVLEGQTVSDTNPLPVTGTFEVTGGSVTTTITGTNLDAFGRLRISDAFTLFDSNFRYADDTDSWNHTVTGAGSSVTYNNNTKTVDLVVSALNDEIIRETTKVFQYQPGKSLLIMSTFSMATDPGAEIEQRVGYFGARNGVYFQTIGNQYSLVIRKDITGTVDSSTEKVLQSAWNGDRLTGAGGANNPSGHTLTPTITQIFWMDIEWLGVGSVRCGFVINGEFIVCHTFHHANNSTLSLTGPYMATASLPLRYEIKRVSGEGTATLRQICSTVISEGGYQPKATLDTASMGVTTKNLATAGTFYPLVSIRLNSSRLDAIVRLATLQSMITTASSAPKNCFYRIIKNATVSGGTWTTHSRGTVDYNKTMTSIAGGTIIGSGYFSASTRAEISGIADINYQLGRTIGGTSDTLTIEVTPDSNNLDVAIDLGWFDLSL